MLFQMTWKKKWWPTTPLLNSVVWKFWTEQEHRKKKKDSIQTRKEVKQFPFIDNMILYIKIIIIIHIKTTRVNKFRKCASYKIDTQKAIVILYTKN